MLNRHDFIQLGAISSLGLVIGTPRPGFATNAIVVATGRRIRAFPIRLD